MWSVNAVADIICFHCEAVTKYIKASRGKTAELFNGQSRGVYCRRGLNCYVINSFVTNPLLISH